MLSGTHAAGLLARISARLGEAGHRGHAVRVERIAELREEIRRRRQAGELDDTLYREWLARFEGGASGVPVGTRSVIVAATPQPMLRLTFERNGTRHAAIVPPTYFNDTDRQVGDLLNAALRPHGYGIQQASLPVKLLAVRCGLAEYGRNNITYIPGMGSFFRLTAFYTDAPLVEIEWREPRLAVACRRCSACRSSCPAGAIASDRFLLHAERCLTFHNERDAPFPGWIDPNWHHCLIGCMRCQTACPLNKPFAHWVADSETFTAEESAQILKANGAEQLSLSAREKLQRLSLLEDCDKLSRNLRAIIDRC